MNKAQLVAEVSKQTGVPKATAERVIDAFVKTVTDALKADGKVTLVGFGTFEVTQRAARKGRNPRTGQIIQIPSTRVPRFKPGRALREAVK